MIGIIDYPERVLPSPGEDEERRIIQRSKARLHELWDRFADQFPAHPFLGGAAPNALDLLATVVSKWSGARAHLRSTRPAWALVFDKVEHHPAFAPVFERHWPAK
jgi:GST-like protein